MLSSWKYSVVLILLAAAAAKAEFADPTKPLIGSAVSEALGDKLDDSLPSLGSVLIGPNRKVAIINGRRYKERDQIGDYWLTEILENQVVLSNGQKRLELRLASKEIKADTTGSHP